MADSINRIVPPSVSVDRGRQIGRERPKEKPGAERRKPFPGGAAAPENQSEEPGGEPDGAAKDKGKHVDIIA
jgi:hypothetical protein